MMSPFMRPQIVQNTETAQSKKFSNRRIIWNKEADADLPEAELVAVGRSKV